MADTYGFLRFQLPGSYFALYLAIFLAPFVSSATASHLRQNSLDALGLLGSLLLLGLAIGYFIHQMAVAKYRRPKEADARPGQRDLDVHLKSQFPAYADLDWSARLTIIDSLLSAAGSVVKEGTKEVWEKLDGRWSHLYARAALGTYSRNCALFVAGLLLLATRLPTNVRFPLIDALIGGVFSFTLVSWMWLGILLIASVAATRWLNGYKVKLEGEIHTLERLVAQSIIKHWPQVAQSFDVAKVLTDSKPGAPS